MRRRGRIDAVQPEIVQALRQVGAEVKSTAALGEGFGDLLVSFRGLHLLECKSRRGRLTAAQVEVHRRWQIQVVRSVDEALSVIGAAK